MAHEVETMAFANATPWHGLGKQVSDLMTPDQMLVAAGLDWTVSKRPLYTIDNPNVWNVVDPTGESNFMPVPKQYALVRDSDNTILGNCGESYTPFQNHEVMRFFKKFTEAGNMKMETAGSLKLGKDIWGLAKIKEGFTLTGGDEIRGYLLVNNSHDAGKAMQIMFTPIRVVCNNTLTMALSQKGQRFRVLHLQMFDDEIIRAAEEAMGLSSQRLEEFSEAANFLASKRATPDQIEYYIADLFQPHTLVERAKSPDLLPPLRDEFKRTAQKVLAAIDLSPGASMVSAKGTWWGALNAVTYVMDHELRSQDTGNALYSSWFGSAASKKRDALAKALEYAK